MDDNTKSILKLSVTTDILRNVQRTFDQHNLVLDESYFDYELLRLALERKHITIVKFLLKLGCRVESPHKLNSEEPVIHLAMKLNNAEIIKKMLKNGASIDDKNPNGETALYAAFLGEHFTAIAAALTFVSTNTLKQLAEYLDESFTFDSTNVDNVRHFHIACVTNHCDAVRYYLKYKFDVNSPLILNSAKFVGVNPLHYAASKEYFYSKLLEILLKNDGDLTIKNSNGQTPLQIIYYSGFSTSSIFDIFKYGNHTKFINSVDDNGVSHFHMACAINYSEYVQTFIDKGVDINSSISSNCSIYPGYTPLHIAVMHGCDKIVQLLLKNGANCNKKSTKGTTPLHLACELKSYHQRKRIFIIEMLLKYDACAAAVDERNCTPLHLAFLNLDLCEETGMLDTLISKIPRAINLTNNEGLSHFHIVCVRSDISRVSDFLQSGVDVNNYVNLGKYQGFTALHFAILLNQKDVVELLLRWNAQVNTKVAKADRPLHLACNFDKKKFNFSEFNITHNKANLNWASNSKNQLDIIKLLLLHGADVDVKDSLGKTPLHSLFIYHPSLYRNHSSEINGQIKEIIEILLLYKANVNACTNSLESILHIVSEDGCLVNSEELTEYLITKGANVNVFNKTGFTPLHLAVKSNKNNVVKILLKYGADVNAKSKNIQKLIPLQMIIKCSSYTPNIYISIASNEVVCSLLENDSFVNVRSEDTKSLLQNVVESRNSFITKQLLDYGADINMQDAFGNSSVSSLLKWELDNNNIHSNNEEYALIFQTVFIHVQKLQALGLYVNEKVQICCTKLRQQYQKALLLPKVFITLKNSGVVNLDNVFDNCLEELNKMRLVKIDNYTSLYDILLKDAHEMSKHVRNGALVNILDDLDDPNINNNLPLYRFLLKIQYKKGLKRYEILKFAKDALFYAIKLDLPDLCYNSVMKNLSNEDVINLKTATKISSKRKFINDQFLDEKPSAKLSKKM